LRNDDSNNRGLQSRVCFTHNGNAESIRARRTQSVRSNTMLGKNYFLVAAISALVMALGQLVIAGRSTAGRPIRNAGFASALVGIGMLAGDMGPALHFPLLRALSLSCFIAYVSYTAWMIRIQIAKPPYRGFLIGLTAAGVLTAIAGYFGLFSEHTAIGLVLMGMATGWLTCIPAAFAESRVKLRNAAYLVGASCSVDVVAKLSGAYQCFTAKDQSFDNFQFGPGFMISFWLMLLGNLGAMMFVFGEQHSKNESIALLDPLTSALNRRGLDLHISGLELHKPQGSVGVIAVDIDNFKKINDEFGHAQGDAVLVECAARLRKALREKDVLARIGGEEFLILVDGANGELTKIVGERLRSTLADREFSLAPNAPIAVTVSIGCTTAGTSIRAISAARLAADESLYAAKKTGKNCVVANPDSYSSRPLAPALASSAAHTVRCALPFQSATRLVGQANTRRSQRMTNASAIETGTVFIRICAEPPRHTSAKLDYILTV
jgi:diguanylate cyclase (GGDEF)-like protein